MGGRRSAPVGLIAGLRDSAPCPASPSSSERGARSATRSTPACSPRSAPSSAGTLGAPTWSSGRRPARSSPPCCGPGCRPSTWCGAAAACRSRRTASRCCAGPGWARPVRGPSRASRAARSPRRPRLRAAVRAPWKVSPGSLAAALLPEGRVPSGNIAVPFENLYGGRWPAATMWIVAVQLDTGRRVVFGRPDAPDATPGEAVRASCAIPAFFEPAEIGGQRYVDGGVHSTTNSDLVAGERPDLVLVSAPMSAVRGATRVGPATAMRQIARLSLAREVAALRGRGIPVVAFQPTAADLEIMAGDSLDPRKFAPVAASGGGVDASPARPRRRARAARRPRLMAAAAHAERRASSPTSTSPGVDDQRADAEERRPFGVDRAQDVEVALDAAGLRAGRHHAAVDRLDDVEDGRAERDAVVDERLLLADARRSRRARCRGSGAGPTHRSSRCRARTRGCARSRGTCRRGRPTRTTASRLRPRSRRRSRSGR